MKLFLLFVLLSMVMSLSVFPQNIPVHFTEKVINDEEYEIEYLKLSSSVRNVISHQFPENLRGLNNIDSIRKISSKLDEKSVPDTLGEFIKKYNRLSNIILSSTSSFYLFSISNSDEAKNFYENEIGKRGYQILRNNHFVINPSGEKVSLMSELYADYFSMIRVGFAALLSNKETKVYQDSNGVQFTDSVSIQNDAVQRLIGGGGNVILTPSYPFIGYTDGNNRFNFRGMLAPRISFDLPAIGTETETWAYNFDLGADFIIYYRGALDILSFFASGRVGYVFGNDVFYQNLLKDDRKGFLFNQFSIGLALNSTFRIAYSFYNGSDFVKTNMKSAISFSIIPN